MDRIKKFLDNVIEATKLIDYKNKGDLKKHNKAIENYRKIAKEIGKEQIPPEFINLLYNEDLEICVATAVCIIELMPYGIIL